MNSLKQLFETILTAGKEESRIAAREVKKALYSSKRSFKGEQIDQIIENAPIEYCKIEENWRQENFVIALAVIYFLHNKEREDPYFLFPWFLNLLWHKNGNIRYAVVRMINDDIGPLTYHVRFPGRESPIKNFYSKTADHILFYIFSNTTEICRKSFKVSYFKHKYVNTLPSGTYKSAQMILGYLRETCGKAYIKKMEQKLTPNMELPGDNNINSNQSKSQSSQSDTINDIIIDFYDIIESGHNLEKLRELIDRNPDFYDSYLYLANDLRSKDRLLKARELEDEAFTRALQTIKNNKGEWPKELFWGDLENRHIIRALMKGADNYWQDGNLEEALNIYRKLLKTNLNDNVGARFSIIALRLGLSFEEYIRQVWPEPTMPHEHLEKWFNKHAHKFPEELEEWKKYYQKNL